VLLELLLLLILLLLLLLLLLFVVAPATLSFDELLKIFLKTAFIVPSCFACGLQKLLPHLRNVSLLLYFYILSDATLFCLLIISYRLHFLPSFSGAQLNENKTLSSFDYIFFYVTETSTLHYNLSFSRL